MDNHAVGGDFLRPECAFQSAKRGQNTTSKLLASIASVSLLGGCFSAASFDETGGGAAQEPSQTSGYEVASDAEYGASTTSKTLKTKTFHENGIDGSGQLIAVVDTGLSDPKGELEGRISDLSINLADDNQDFTDEAGHGTQMAIAMAAGANDFGLVGIAPDANILAIKADRLGSPTQILASAVAEGVQYAVDNGADIINLSIQGNISNYSPLNEAIAHAANNDIVVVISTGNSGNSSSPTNSARNVGTTEYGDTTIAVTALNGNDEIASFATPCDVYDPYFCVAVQAENISTMNGNGTEIIASGTSIAAAQVSGSVALLLEYFPNLTSGEAIEILLRTTDDLGAAGVDRVYGSGKINLERALQPVGSIQLGNNAPTKNFEDSYIVVSGASGGSLAQTASFSEIAVSDEYDRLFTIDFSSRIFDRQDDEIFENNDVYSEYAVSFGEDDELLFAFGQMENRNQGEFGLKAVNASLYTDPLRDFGGLEFGTYWLHEKGQFAFDIGTASDNDFQNQYFGMGVSVSPFDELSLRAGLGYLHETSSVLDMEINGALGGLHDGESLSLGLSAVYQADGFQLFGNYAVTESTASFSNTGTVSELRDFQTQSWNVGVGFDDVIAENDKLSFGFGQSTRAVSGEIYVDTSLSENRDEGNWVSLVPDATEYVAEIGYQFQLTNNLSSSINAIYVANPGHDADLEGKLGIGIGVTASF